MRNQEKKKGEERDSPPPSSRIRKNRTDERKSYKNTWNTHALLMQSTYVLLHYQSLADLEIELIDHGLARWFETCKPRAYTPASDELK